MTYYLSSRTCRLARMNEAFAGVEGGGTDVSDQLP